MLFFLIHLREYVLADVDTAKFNFIRETLQKTIRLSYYDRIKDTLPESFKTSPVFPSDPPSIIFAYGENFETEGKYLR